MISKSTSADNARISLIYPDDWLFITFDRRLPLSSCVQWTGHIEFCPLS